MTRVGEGPFPSEIAGPDQERLRELGGEYGTVTGRERRCGWLDLVALRYAVRVNGITLARADEARRALGVRRAPRLRRATACATGARRALPRAPVRLPPRRAGVAGPPRLAASRSTSADQRARAAGGCAARTSSSWPTSSACRSSWSASAPRASACSPDPRGRARVATRHSRSCSSCRPSCPSR